jgi:hypothetical protein
MSNRITRGEALVGSLVASDTVTAGDLVVGGGDPINAIDDGTATLSFTSIPATGTASAAFTVTGVAAGDVVLVNANQLSSASVALSHVSVTAADTVTAFAINAGSASVSASATVTYVWFDLT